MANSNANESVVCNFKIPVKKDLLFDEPANYAQFWVKDKTNVKNLTEETLVQKIEEISRKLCNPGSECLDIIQNDYFDLLCSANYYVDHVSPKIKIEIFQLLKIAFENLVKYMEARKIFDIAEENYISSNMTENLSKNNQD